MSSFDKYEKETGLKAVMEVREYCDDSEDDIYTDEYVAWLEEENKELRSHIRVQHDTCPDCLGTMAYMEANGKCVHCGEGRL